MAEKEYYLKPAEFEKLILADIKKGKLSDKAKEQIFLLIEKLLNKNNFRNYDEDTKRDMMTLGYEYFTRYWTNYTPYRYKITVKKDEKNKIAINAFFEDNNDDIKNHIINAANKALNDDNGHFKINLTDTELLSKFIKYLEENNIGYELKKEKNSIFAYFTQIIKNGFIQVLNNKNSKFMYKVSDTRYNQTNIYSFHKEDRVEEIGKNGSYDLELSNKNDYGGEEYGLDEKIERLYERIDYLKKNKNNDDFFIVDRNYIVQALFEVADDLTELVFLAYKISGDYGNLKKIYEDKTLVYLLTKINIDI